MPQPNGKQQNFADPLPGIWCKFKIRKGPLLVGFLFFSLAVPEPLDRVTTSHHHAVTGSHKITFGVGAIYAESPM
jgi:hypothetical protein